MRHFVFGLFLAAALASPSRAANSPSSSASASTPTPSATPGTASPMPSPTPVPILPPRDAPAVRSTTPPLVPVPVPATPAAPDSVWLGGSTTIAVPIAMHGERPFIQVLIDGHPALLIVDTGALVTTIDTGSVDESAEAISLQIGDVRFPKLKMVRADVRSYAERNFGAGADGIIGRDLLARYPVLVDFPNHLMTIYRDSRSAAAAQPQGSVALALRVIDGLPAIAGSLDAQPPRWFAFDTGASSQINLDSSAEHASGLAHPEHSLPYQETALSGNVIGVLVRARSLTVGSVTFNQPLVALLNTPRNQPSELVGALGTMILTRLSFFIDELSSSASIVAPAGSTSARLYDPSGIALEMRRDTIVVRSVVPGAPADTAHIRPGDEIVSINGLAPATLDFARQLLDGNPGTKVQIVYRRWHLVHSATLTLHVII